MTRAPQTWLPRDRTFEWFPLWLRRVATWPAVALVPVASRAESVYDAGNRQANRSRALAAGRRVYR